MRIALVSDFYLPGLGGAQTSVLNQRRALEAAGHDVFLFVPFYGPSEPTDNERTFRVPSFRAALPGFPLVAPSKKLHTRLQQQFTNLQIELVHIQTEFGLASTAVAVARVLKLPVFYTVHTFAWQTNLPLPKVQATLFQGIYRAAYSRKLSLIKATPGQDAATRALKSLTFSMVQASDVIICPSQNLSTQLRQAGSTKPHHVLPNPLVLGKRSAPKPLPKVPRFVWPSRCLPEKRLLEFIDAALLVKTSQPFFVDIIGDGPLLPEAQKRAAAQPHIIFHGRKSQQEVIELIDSGSVVVVSSYKFDNQPMIIAEAISRHRGILYCDPALREGTTHAGHLTKPAPAALAKGMMELIENPTLIQQLSKGAERDKALFSGEHFSATIQQIYRGQIDHSS